MSKKKKLKIGHSLDDLFENSSQASPQFPSDTNRDNQDPLAAFIAETNAKTKTKTEADSESVSIPTELIHCPPAINQVRFTQKAFEDVILMSKAINEISQDVWGPESEKLEVYCYVLTDANLLHQEEPARITSIFIPYHTAGEMTVNVAPKAILELQKYLEKTNKVLLGWAHSHGHFDVYSSRTDEVNHKTLLHDTSNYIELNRFRMKYIYGITVNDASERLGVILTQYPCTHIQRAEDSEFDIEGEPYSISESNQRFQEIKTMLEERVDVIPPANNMSAEEQIKNLSNEFLDVFLQNLRKSKNFLLEEMPEIFDEHFDVLQQVLERHDEILVDVAEESFQTFSERLIKTIQAHKDDI